MIGLGGAGGASEELGLLGLLRGVGEADVAIRTVARALTAAVVCVLGSVPIPVAVAVFLTLPAFTSALVTVCRSRAVHVSDLPGARPGAPGVGQSTGPRLGSDTWMRVKSTLPRLVTVNE